MIYLHDPCVLFLKPRKVAGTSFEIALSRFAGPNDILTPIGKAEEQARASSPWPAAQNFGFAGSEEIPEAALVRSRRRAEVPSKFYNHISASEAKELLGADRWGAAERISIIRNPFDLAVSFYFWRKKRGFDVGEFGDWCQANLDLLTLNRASYSVGGESVIHHLLRYERIAQDILALEARLPKLAGLGDVFSSTTAKSGVRPQEASTAAMFAPHPAAEKAIKTAFSVEIAQYGYSVET